MRSPRAWPPAALAMAMLFALAACGSAMASTAPSAIIDGLYVTDAWVRPPLGLDRPGAGYLTIHNTFGEDVALIGVSSPVATSVEIHETMAGDSGMMGMQPVDRIEIPSGSVVTFEPGGYHLMLMAVSGMPAVGGTVELTLTFEHVGDIVVQAEVRAG